MAKEKNKEALKLGYRAVIAVSLGVIVILVLTLFITHILSEARKLPEIPTPEVSEGMRGQLGIDKNVNESTIDRYLNREDSVYRDMRLLVDPAKYEEVGGDRYLSGIVSGFEVVPLPYIITPEGLPEEVGESYTGRTLFSRTKDGKAYSNYTESMEVLEYLFPKDKNIFLMCGGGGYAGMMKNLLVELGWDENKIWNVGGYWYYEGENNERLAGANGKYDFWKLKYHLIDFDYLTEKRYDD